MTPPPIRADRVSFSYEERQVLDDFSVDVDPGNLVCIVGPNGSGKSTVLRLLAGELNPRSGSVTMGTPIADLAPAERAGVRAFLGQSERSDVPYTVRTVVEFGTYATHTDLASETDVLAVMRSVEVDHLADRIVAELSGGERRRVAIARTLLQGAPALLMDEPTDSLDLGHADMVMAVCGNEAKSGRPVVLSTHDLNLAARYADRIVLLDEGVTMASGTPDEVLTEELLSAIYRCDVRIVRRPEDGLPMIYVAGNGVR